MDRSQWTLLIDVMLPQQVEQALLIECDAERVALSPKDLAEDLERGVVDQNLVLDPAEERMVHQIGGARLVEKTTI